MIVQFHRARHDESSSCTDGTIPGGLSARRIYDVRILSVSIDHGVPARSRAGCRAFLRVALDKSEGVVKTEISWAVREHRLLCQRRLRTKTLEISPESLCGGVVPPTIHST